MLGATSPQIAVSLAGNAGKVLLEKVPVDRGNSKVSTWAVRVPARGQPIDFVASFTSGPSASIASSNVMPSGQPPRRWPQEITTTVTRSTAKDPYVVDDIGLPVDNPWHRNVRLADIQFLRDGTGVVVTLDGDVWLVRGLGDSSGVARWRRFASGFHEPLTLAIRDDQIYVFDRNGIWRPRDTNGDGEADVHELFSNAFAQTADMREFPSMHSARAWRRVRHCERRAGGGDVRETQRQRAPDLG